MSSTQRKPTAHRMDIGQASWTVGRRRDERTRTRRGASGWQLVLLPYGVGGSDPIPNLINQVDLTGSLCYCLAVSGGLVYAFAAPSATVHVFSTSGTPRE